MMWKISARWTILFLLSNQTWLAAANELDMAQSDKVARVIRARNNMNQDLQQGNSRRNQELWKPPPGDPVNNFSTTCAYCGERGSCGRTKPLNEYFTVDFSDTMVDSIVFAACAWPVPDTPSCYYAVGGIDPSLEHTDGIRWEEFDELFDDCPCCNYLYPRDKGFNRRPWARLYCEVFEGYCPMVEKICQLKDTKHRSFSCPVGTYLTMEGGFGDTTLKVRDGVIVEYGDNCVANHDTGTVRCTAPPLDSDKLSMSVTVSADDCGCVNCKTGNITMGVCRAPIADDIYHVGYCAESEDVCPTGTGPLRFVPDRADDVDYSGLAAYNREQLEIVERIEGHVKALASGIRRVGGQNTLLQQIHRMRQLLNALKTALGA